MDLGQIRIEGLVEVCYSMTWPQRMLATVAVIALAPKLFSMARWTQARTLFALPAHIPTAASFVVVYVGTDVHPFVIGAMPAGTTMALPSA